MPDFKKFDNLLAESIDSVAYVSDIDTYELLYMNSACLSLYGNPTIEQWYKKKCYEFLQGKSAPCEFCTNSFLVGTKPYIWEYYNPIVEKYFHIKDQKVFMDDKNLRLELADDMTDSIASLKQSRALNACVETLHSNETPDESIYKLLKIMSDFYAADRAYIFLLSENKINITNTHEYCQPNIESQKLLFQQEYTSDYQIWLDLLSSNGIISFNFEKALYDFDINLLSKEWIAKLGSLTINSCLLTPLVDKNGNPSGYLGLDNPRSNINRKFLISSVNIFVSDFLNKNKLIEELHTLSYKDTLTGLRNRNSYRERLELFEKKSPNKLGVIHIDINGLKEINEARGHLVGDNVVVEVANVLQEIFPDTCYRVAGDEFIVFKEDVGKELFEAEVELLRRKINKADNYKVSIGVVWSDNCTNISSQIDQSDELMYVDKQSYYNAGIKNPKYHKMLLNALLHDIADKKFHVYLQPQVDLATGDIVSAEALVRRIDEIGNIEAPYLFIPMYEKEEIIPYLDFHMFESVCAILADWNKKDIGKEVSIAINFSRCTLQQENIALRINEISKKYHIEPARLLIEITESTQSLDKDNLYNIILSLGEYGFKVSLDDFGSGYSNLSILADYCFDEIKIDKSLIDDITVNKKMQMLTKSALELCKNLNITSSVAEGIEYEEQYNLVKKFKCSKGQGYYFAKPMPTSEFEKKYLL